MYLLVFQMLLLGLEYHGARCFLVTRIHEAGATSSRRGERILGLPEAGENMIPLVALQRGKGCCAFLLSTPELLR